MKEIEATIIQEVLVGENLFYSIQDNSDWSTHLVPKIILDYFNVRVGDIRTFYQKIEKKSGKIIFRLKNEIKEYPIIGHEKVKIKGEPIQVFKVAFDDNSFTNVYPFSWQNVETWPYKNLRCEIWSVTFDNKILLENRDYRHPIFEVGKIYNFEITDEGKNKYDFFILKGEDGGTYQVNKFPSQILNDNIGKTIQCKVKSIDRFVQLSQTSFGDPYFVDIYEIVSNKTLVNKYFSSVINGSGDDEILKKLEYQYVNKHAFWVFTFTNQILLSNFKDNIKNYNYQKAKEINTLIIDFEEWILNKGIISSITDEVLKENTRAKARSQLRTAKIINEILDEIVKIPFQILESKLLNKENKLEYFYYFISIYDVSILDHNKVVMLLTEMISQEKIINGNNEFLFRKLLRIFTNKKKIFIDGKKDVYFSFTTNNLQEGLDKENYSKYLAYSYCEFILANFLKQWEFTNILLGQLLKRWIKNVSEIDLKYDLLLNAYMHFENYQSLKIIDPFFFDSELRVDSKKLLKFQEFDENQIKNWNKIEHSFSAGKAILVRLTKRSNSGFEVVYRGIKGFLPKHKIYDKYLRHYILETCDFTIEVKCFSYSNLFKFFVVEQIPEDGDIFYVKNNTKKIIGKVYDAVIKRIEPYGYFLSTELGEGLLHTSKILDDSDNRNSIHPIFKENEKIKVVLFQVSPDDKLEFSFSLLKQADPDYYNDFLKELFKTEVGINNHEYEEIQNITSESYFDKVQEEKASCFEQNALLQTEIEKKIHNFKLARQFYSMTNNAKSFLLNIYTSYFEILLNIKECIHNRSLLYLATIKHDAVRIKKEINTKTIETFPDSEKLINFLEIISLFNENTQASFERLYKFISSDLKSSENTIKAIAKITMANNLLISESQEKENSEFCFKNLSHISNYISNGILSLNETIDDIYAKEQKEQILYWKEKIRGSENERFELKSSLLNPIQNEASLKRIETLKRAPQTETVKNDMSRINGSFAKKAIVHSALKTLAAFANTYGGDLLIGVADDGKIIGLQGDYNTLKPQDRNRDGYGKYLDDLIKSYLGDSFSSLISRKFINFPEGDILVISVRPSPEEVFLLKNEEGANQEQLYIRSASSSRCLEGSELAKFIKTKNLNKIENILHENEMIYKLE